MGSLAVCLSLVYIACGGRGSFRVSRLGPAVACGRSAWMGPSPAAFDVWVCHGECGGPAGVKSAGMFLRNRLTAAMCSSFRGEAASRAAG